MGRFWSRHLLYGDAQGTATPMWAREPTRVPIFEEAVVSETPMWRSSLRLTNVPVFVDDNEPSPEPMWHRTANYIPVCPCCVSGTGCPPQTRSTHRQASRGSSTDAPNENADSDTGSVEAEKPTHPLNTTPSNAGLRRSVTTVSLRLKNSVRSLRHKASGLSR